MSGTVLNATQSSFRKKIREPSSEIQYILLKEKKNRSKNNICFLADCYGRRKTSWSAPVRVLVYVDSNLADIEGTLIASYELPERIRKSNMPGTFDFARYAATQDVFHQLYLSIENADVISKPIVHQESVLEKIRNGILQIISNKFKDRREAGLAEALLIGYRKDMDPEMTKAYLDTGVVHVIAISGMHLGLIFGLINILVTYCFGQKGARRAGLFISLPILWGFAIITGSSASVMRSVLMFSFLIAANSFRRRNKGLNALFGSALILLFLDPDIIFDIGFQLSYAAVFSIMLFNKPIESWIFVKNPLLNHFWKLISMTLAAQVLTTPFVLFHFHRFPTLFLFTNLVAVPLSSLLLLLEILLLIVSPFQSISGLIVKTIQLVMQGMNGYISAMAKVPFGMINDIQGSIFDLMMGTLLLVVLIHLLRSPSKILWRLLIMGILGFTIGHTTHQLLFTRNEKIFIGHTRSGFFIVHQHGQTANIMIPEKWSQNQILQESLKNFCISKNIKKKNWNNVPDRAILINIIDQYQLMHQMSSIPQELLKSMLSRNHTLLADGSFKMWKIRELQKAAIGLHLRFESLRDEGLITINCHQYPHNR